ncbi:MAG: FAD:protein FMN transferase [Gemmatimonadota bacterium]|nr:FAD:protein FMN transferase [Gemmatimonadota bacterium]
MSRSRDDGSEYELGRRDFLTLGIGALAVAGLPVAARMRPTLVRRRIPVMGTVAEIAIPTRNEAWAQRAMDAAFSELRRVDRTMSRFRDDSDVGRLNAESGWVRLSQDTGTVLVASTRWAARSTGRFDPCLGRASALWDVEHRRHPPAEREVEAFAHAELWQALEVETDDQGARARLTSPDAAVDLGGIAKGFGVDKAAEALRSFGVVNGLVNVGGDLVALGTDLSGEPWRIGVRDPASPDGLAATLSASDEAVATSGDYLSYFRHGGRRYHHLLDPATGGPYVGYGRSLTVGAARCLDADAAATALFAGGETESARILGRAPGDIRIIHDLMEATT